MNQRPEPTYRGILVAAIALAVMGFVLAIVCFVPVITGVVK